MPYYDNEYEAISRRGRRFPDGGRRAGVPADRTQVPGAAAAAQAIVQEHLQTEIRQRILDLERELSALRREVVQYERLVENGVAQYRGLYASRKAEADALEAQLNALHAQKV